MITQYLIILLNIVSIQQVIFEMNYTLDGFVARTELLFAVPLPELLRFRLGYCQYLILLDFGFEKKAIQTKRNFKNMLSQGLVGILQKMSMQERIDWYYQLTEFVFRIAHGNLQPPPISPHPQKIPTYYKTPSHKKWHQCNLILHPKSNLLQIHDFNSSPNPKLPSPSSPSLPSSSPNPSYLNLSEYLLRHSKPKDNYSTFNLEACDRRVRKDMRKVKIGVKGDQEFREVFGWMRDVVGVRQWDSVVGLFCRDPVTRGCVGSIGGIGGMEFLGTERLEQEEERFYSCSQIPEDQPKNDDQQSQKYENTLENAQKQHRIPAEDTQYTIWDSQQKLKLMDTPSQWQVMIENEEFKLSKNKSYTLLLQINLRSHIEPSKLHQHYLQSPNKNLLTQTQLSQTTCLLCLKKFTQLTRPRAFQITRKHLPQNNPHFLSIHQYKPVQLVQVMEDEFVFGDYQAIWRFGREGEGQGQGKAAVKVMVEIGNGGYLSVEQNFKMNVWFVKCIFQRFVGLGEPQKNEQVRFFQKDKLKICQQTNQLKPILPPNPNYKTTPLKKGTHQTFSRPLSHPQKILSEDWKRDDENGGLEYLNKQKIAAQKGVIKHIISQMGRNLFSGKSILNVSLPVEIFSAESHLERLLHSLRLAPKIFQQIPLPQKQNLSLPHLQLLLQLSSIFGITTSLLYLSQQKSFNPILGQTCQMWIDGCPAYAEQISHHPPISAIYFLGRGYRIWGQLQAKVQIGVNSGKGANDGEVVVEFQNGVRVSNYFAAGEVSGLSYGKRKFNLTGKSHHFIQQHGLHLQLTFKPQSNTFHKKFSKIPGTQLQNFKKTRKIKSTKKQLESEQKQGQPLMHGTWNKEIYYDGGKVFDIDSLELCRFDCDQWPIPSDCVWRGDVDWRRKGEIGRAQQQKVMLEQMQRNDRKLRSLKK